MTKLWASWPGPNTGGAGEDACKDTAVATLRVSTGAKGPLLSWKN